MCGSGKRAIYIRRGELIQGMEGLSDDRVRYPGHEYVLLDKADEEHRHIADLSRKGCHYLEGAGCMLQPDRMETG